MDKKVETTVIREIDSYRLDGRDPVQVKLTGKWDEIDKLLQKLGDLDSMMPFEDEQAKEDYESLASLLLDTGNSRFSVYVKFSQNSQGDDVYTVKNHNFEGYSATEWERVVKSISELAPNLVVESEAPAWHPVTGQQATISVNRVSETEHIPEHLESWYSDRWTSIIDYVFDDDGRR